VGASGLRGKMAHMAQVASVTTTRKAPIGKPFIWQATVLAALVGLLYARIVGRLVEQWWSDPNFSHGFFVPAFAFYVVWENRSRLAEIRPAPSIWGLAVILLGLCVLILGVFGAELFLSRVSLLVLAAGLALFFLGWEYLRAVSFPLLFLILMVPIPAIIFSQITFPLQILASKLSASLLPLFGVPVFREGNVINLPAMPLEVAEACSGIRSLLSLTTLAIMYGYLVEKRVAIRVALALGSIPIAVAANALRIVGTGLLVQYWDPEKAEGFFHAFSGWLIFVVSLLMLFGLHRGINALLSRREAAA
jgi:exosortase